MTKKLAKGLFADRK